MSIEAHREMVEHLKAMRELARTIPPHAAEGAVMPAMVRSTVAQAHATAALALAVSNGLNDIEVALTRLAEAVENR
jgi:hypothetical protein